LGEGIPGGKIPGEGQMIVTMHQPNFLPWAGFFYKMSKADLFVYADDLGFSRGSYTQRVKIKSRTGPRWLTLPLVHTGSVSEPILQVRIGGWNDWRERVLGPLKGNYLHYPHYKPYGEKIAEIIMTAPDNLAEFNIQLIAYLAEAVGITTPTVRSSTLGVPPTPSATDWIITVAKKVGADVFLSGFGGANYQDEPAYAKAGIRLLYTDFQHPVYPQKEGGGFFPGLSIVDLVFNCGPGSGEILRSARKAPP
jgi:hypothetical protein